jgi:hypothetical protein
LLKHKHPLYTTFFLFYLVHFSVMKSSLFATLATAALLTATNAFAAPLQGPGNNYGYDKNHRVTPQERARWEAQHKNDRHDNDHKDDRRDNDRRDNDRRDNDHKNDRRDNDRKDDKFDRNKNYGFDQNHRVTPQERARWEAQHKNDRHDNDHR